MGNIRKIGEIGKIGNIRKILNVKHPLLKKMQDTELKIESTTTMDGVGGGNKCIETLLHGY